MPKFYIDLEEPSGEADVVGQELEDIQAAKCAAIRMIADTLCKHPQAFWDADRHRVRVSDDYGITLFVVDITTTTSPIARSFARARV